MLLIVLNGLVFLGIWGLRFWMQKKYEWFVGGHLKVPEWLVVFTTGAGYFIPVTPLLIDGMIIGAVAYFGNEWLYQRWGISPLGHIFNRLDLFVRWVVRKAL